MPLPKPLPKTPYPDSLNNTSLYNNTDKRYNTNPAHVHEGDTKTTTEQIEIYTTYDENGKTERRVGENFSLTIDVKNVVSEIPTIPDPDPSAVPVILPPSPFTGIMHKYDINADEWSTVTAMDDSRGNFFM